MGKQHRTRISESHLFDFRTGKNEKDHPKIEDGLAILIGVGKSIRLEWVSKVKDVLCIIKKYLNDL